MSKKLEDLQEEYYQSFEVLYKYFQRIGVLNKLHKARIIKRDSGYYLEL